MAYAFVRSLCRTFRSPGMSLAIKGQPAFLQVSTFSVNHPPSQTSAAGDRIPKTQIDIDDGIEELDCLNNNLMENHDLEAGVIEPIVDDGINVDVDRSVRKATASQGIYKAFLLGEVGHGPYQKVMQHNRTVTLFSLGTGGMRNNRRPFLTETPEEYAHRGVVQWHRITVYQEKFANLAMIILKKGSRVYVEGNLETRVFYEPKEGVVKRINEVAVRKNGRLLFMDQSANHNTSNNNDISA